MTMVRFHHTVATFTMVSLFLCLIATAAAHSQLIYPKPQNVIGSLLPEWKNGKAPPATDWHPHGDRPCACRNDTEFCDAGQTCLWFTVGTSIGCKEPDGAASNPNFMGDRCSSGMNATVNNPLHRTINRDAAAFSEEDWTRFNPWRAPGSAPVYDPCGRAGGGPHSTAGEGVYTTTKFAKLGDLGSKLPQMPTGAVWKAGSIVEAKWSLRANHGGGYQYRLCPLKSNLTEACMQQTPMPFAGNSSMMLSNGTIIKLKSTFVSEGTLPVGSTWQMNPVPGYINFNNKTGHPTISGSCCKHWFDPPCYDPAPLPNYEALTEGICSGEWLTNITLYDQLRVPEHLEPGEYVLGFRWDCKASGQIWQSCADVTITAKANIVV